MLLEDYLKKIFDFELLKNPKAYFSRLISFPLVKTPLLWIFIISIISTFLTIFYIDLGFFPNFDDTSEYFLFLILGVLIEGVAFPILKITLLTSFHYLYVKIMRTTASYTSLFSMNTQIYLLLTFGYLLNSLASILLGYKVSPFNLNFIIQADGAPAILFNSIDLFSFLVIFLTIIGLQIVGRFSKVTSWTLAISLYILKISSLFLMYKLGIL
ncbi:hypothetical protein LAV72_11920 [Lysinibacillus xylanilyticus]|uniref:hypothetical protein n=1 Tax=Lysinibacillus xylanilyticus TaxID=582475 RepID=UPI002B24CDF7|nr:hypothetical protein [Lysinibacillus xylanilyticus]MEB2300322.1 hypothetical protein [Lysinibacillus xylanilyticus]